jgi:7,8-dihydropterin-6-yl-methyl-4-(beta-D-ribofuranosyl)aminobenzene 5'-phosphate synthase
VRITTLIENSPSDSDAQLTAEWGLSLHVAVNGRQILFDTGATGAFARNAERLSVNPAAVDAAVLSHHHFDHGGGLKRFFELNAGARVHLGRMPEGECWFKRLLLLKRYIGLDTSLFGTHAERFSEVIEPVEILPDVFLLPEIGGAHARPAGNRSLCLRDARGFRPDDFRHEIVMVIKEKDQLVVFTGCSHSGVLNMIAKAATAFPGVPIKAVIGGFHMVSVPPFNTLADSADDVAAVGRAVLNYPVGMTWTGHCTGAKAFEVLKRVMGDRLKAMKTGTVIEV